MKTRSLFIISAITIIAALAMGLKTEQRVYAGENWGNAKCVAVVVKNLKASEEKFKRAGFYIHSFNGVKGSIDRAIPKSQIRTVENLEDIIDLNQFGGIEKYQAVWVKRMFKDEDISIMSESSALNDDQKALFRNAEFGDYFDVIINHERVDFISGEVSQERLDFGITVVPELQAEYPDGYKALVAFFNNSSREYFSSLDFTNFNTAGFRFIISEEGKAIEIENYKESGVPEVDSYIFELIQIMPTWNPAMDNKGNNVQQEYELIYGSPGC